MLIIFIRACIIDIDLRQFCLINLATNFLVSLMHRSYLVLCLIIAVVFAQQQRPLNLRVMSYNVHAGRDFHNVLNVSAIADVIKGYNPDIVGLQELGLYTCFYYLNFLLIFFYSRFMTPFLKDMFTTRSPFNMPQLIANLTGMNYVFHKTIDYQGGEYGIAVLCKHNITVRLLFHSFVYSYLFPFSLPNFIITRLF